MDDVTWGALTLTLTLLGGTWTWYAFRRRGPASGTRGAAVTLLPAAAWLTGTLELFTEVAGSVGDWATHLVLDPTVWLGIVLAGLSAVLFGVSGAMRSRGRGGPREPRATSGTPRSGELGPGRAAPPPLDDDLADIEALLRKRGIT
jgi:hypothetical protein